MFKDKLLSPRGAAYDEDDTCTLLDQDASFEGKLTFDGTVQILGTFKGDIFSSGTLLIGDTANVEGNIEVGVLQISGAVKGILHAKERLELLAKARVTADISTGALMVEQGAQFQGHCQMGQMSALTTPQRSEARQATVSPLHPGVKLDKTLDQPPPSLEEIELFQ